MALISGKMTCSSFYVTAFPNGPLLGVPSYFVGGGAMTLGRTYTYIIKSQMAILARFLGRAGLLKFWPCPVLARPTIGPTQPSPARPIATSTYTYIIKSRMAISFGEVADREGKHSGEEASGHLGA